MTIGTDDTERLHSLRKAIANLYAGKHPNRADWADWIYEGHAVLVGNAARQIALRFGGNPELAEAAGLLHDVADAVMKREDPAHETRSLEIARELLAQNNFSNDEIKIIVDDAIAKHSCHDAIRPNTLEGKAMASADGVIHMTTDFYNVAETRRKVFQTKGEISAWALPKIDRDFKNKIAYDELRAEVRPKYERLKARFE